MRGQEQADIPRTRGHAAEEGHDEQRPERGDAGKTDARGHHHPGGDRQGKRLPTSIMAMAEPSNVEVLSNPTESIDMPSASR